MPDVNRLSPKYDFLIKSFFQIKFYIIVYLCSTQIPAALGHWIQMPVVAYSTSLIAGIMNSTDLFDLKLVNTRILSHIVLLVSAFAASVNSHNNYLLVAS